MDAAIKNTAYQTILTSKHILITTHQKMDGDGLSSMLALYKVLRTLGKEVTLLCQDHAVPEVYQFLPHTESVSFQLSGVKDFIISVSNANADLEEVRYIMREDGGADIIISPKKGKFHKGDFSFREGAEKFDLIITVDTGELKLLGTVYEEHREMFERVPLMNIDHHWSNDNYGTINLVDKEAVSTTEVIYHLLKEHAPELIDAEVATLLLTGIIVDTRSFQNPNTTSRSLEIASELLHKGAAQQEIIRNIYKTKKLSTLKLWGRILSRLKVDNEYRIVWSFMTKQDLEEYHAEEAETEGIIDELISNAPQTDIVLFFKEGRDGVIGISVRTKRPDISAIAITEMFGGGGHLQAAGCKLPPMPIQEAQKKVLDVVKAIEDAKKIPAPRVEEPKKEHERTAKRVEEQSLPKQEVKKEEKVREQVLPELRPPQETPKKEEKKTEPEKKSRMSDELMI